MTVTTEGPPHYSDGELQIYKFPSGPLDNNSYLIVCPDTNRSIVIDTPADASRMVEAARRTDVQMVLITHSHFDHILGYEEILAELDVEAGIGRPDAGDLPSPPRFLIDDGDEFTAGGVTLRAIATPGHTPGSTSFVTGRHLFAGDTLFPGGPGKSDSPRAFTQLVDSISTRLLTLDGRTTIYPGHGADGSLQDAIDEYEAFASRPHPEGLYGDVVWLEN